MKLTLLALFLATLATAHEFEDIGSSKGKAKDFSARDLCLKGCDALYDTCESKCPRKPRVSGNHPAPGAARAIHEHKTCLARCEASRQARRIQCNSCAE